MATMRKAALVATMLGIGLASQGGAAFAQEGHHDGDTQRGIANVDGTKTIVPTDVCGNDVPVNALGVQIPLQDITADVPLLSPSGDGGGNASQIQKNCGHDVDADS
jgi:hypothetical protein